MTSSNGSCKTLTTQRSDFRWQLEAAPGQKIQLSLIDFDWSSEQSGNEQRAVKTTCFGYIATGGGASRVALCSRGQRVQQLHLPRAADDSRVAEVVLTSQEHLPNFLIHYKGEWTRLRDKCELLYIELCMYKYFCAVQLSGARTSNFLLMRDWFQRTTTTNSWLNVEKRNTRGDWCVATTAGWASSETALTVRISSMQVFGHAP